MSNEPTPETPTTLLCEHCGKPATCIGEYETTTGIDTPACDDCCGHGNEDGHCSPIVNTEPPTAWQECGQIIMATATEVVQWASIQRNVLLNEFSIREIIEAGITPALRERDELKAEVERMREEASHQIEMTHKYAERNDRLRVENAGHRAALTLIANELEGCGSSAECVDTAQRCIDEARAALAKHAPAPETT